MIHYCMIIIIANLRFFFEFVNKVLIDAIITIFIIYLLYHSLCWCLLVHQPGAYHAPGASDTQVNHSDE